MKILPCLQRRLFGNSKRSFVKITIISLKTTLRSPSPSTTTTTTLNGRYENPFQEFHSFQCVCLWLINFKLQPAENYHPTCALLRNISRRQQKRVGFHSLIAAAATCQLVCRLLRRPVWYCQDADSQSSQRVFAPIFTQHLSPLRCLQLLSRV